MQIQIANPIIKIRAKYHDLLIIQLLCTNILSKYQQSCINYRISIKSSLLIAIICFCPVTFINIQRIIQAFFRMQRKISQSGPFRQGYGRI